MSYSVIDLGTLGGDVTTPYDINERGQIVGESQTGDGTKTHAFLWDPTTGMHDLGTLGGSSSAKSINDLGEVVGWSAIPGLSSGLGFVWRRGAGLRVLPPLPGQTSSRAAAINNHGQIVGWSKGTAPTFYTPTLWAGNDVVNLGTVGGQSAEARDVNDRGQVLGKVGSILAGPSVIWENGAITEIGSLGQTDSSGLDINERGEVTGSSPVEGPGGFTLVSRPFLYSRNQSVHDLGTLGCGGSDVAFGSGTGINDNQQIVGTLGCVADPPSQDATVAAIWESGNGWRNLNDLIPPGSGWELISAAAINNRGQIIGVGFESFEYRAFLLTPDQAPVPVWTACRDGAPACEKSLSWRNTRNPVSQAPLRNPLQEILYRALVSSDAATPPAGFETQSLGRAFPNGVRERVLALLLATADLDFLL
jgi:probable HAF family extracellular repeat protein